MMYRRIIQMNPNDNELTVNSSLWWASRIPVGLGSFGVSVPSWREARMRTCDPPSLATSALLSMDDNGNIVNDEAQAATMTWRGTWGIGNNAVIGRGLNWVGLVCPMNTYNVGYRYRNGLRPQRVN